MSTLYVLLFGISMIILGRIILKSWFNHLTLYSLIWTIVLCFTTIRLINYHAIIFEVWFFIFAAWIALYLGSITTVCARSIAGIDTSKSDVSHNILLFPNIEDITRRLKTIIIILSIAGFVAIFLYWLQLLERYGSIAGVIAHMVSWYHLKHRNLVSAGIPYLSLMPITACVFAGIYAGLKRKISFVTIVPIILVILYSFLRLGRTELLMATIMFLTSYIITRKYQVTRDRRSTSKKRIIPIAIMMLLIVLSADQIRAVRKINESFREYGENKSMAVIRNIPLLTPSVYWYLSGSPVVFSEYLRKDVEHVYPGWYTFAPVCRILAKFGLVESPPYVQPFYSTPIPMNAGTYLREVHADFGLAGVFVFPFFIGIICSIVYLKQHFRIVTIVILAHLYAVILLSYHANIIGFGSWGISLIVSLSFGYLLEIRARKT